ncbi:DUF4189 domain-containing protein [Coralloluteibacterium stylophorae]
MGDTIRAGDRWGAVAVSQANGRGGWTVDGKSEAHAESLAVRNCTERGGHECQAVFTFQDSCGVVATNAHRSKFVARPDIEVARRRALRLCGSDCRVLFEGCAVD